MSILTENFGLVSIFYWIAINPVFPLWSFNSSRMQHITDYITFEGDQFETHDKRSEASAVKEQTIPVTET